LSIMIVPLLTDVARERFTVFGFRLNCSIVSGLTAVQAVR
jgi:hypothetical protein